MSASIIIVKPSSKAPASNSMAVQTAIKSKTRHNSSDTNVLRCYISNVTSHCAIAYLNFKVCTWLSGNLTLIYTSGK